MSSKILEGHMERIRPIVSLPDLNKRAEDLLNRFLRGEISAEVLKTGNEILKLIYESLTLPRKYASTIAVVKVPFVSKSDLERSLKIKQTDIEKWKDLQKKIREALRRK